MRKIFFVLVLISTMSSAQKLEFQSIDSLNAKKEILFSGAKSWVSNTFNSSKSVIDMDDKDSGRIIGKAFLQDSKQHRCMSYYEISSVSFKFTIDVKDNKYRIVLSDFNHLGKQVSAGSLDSDQAPAGFGFGCGKKNAQRVYDEIKLNVKDQSEKLFKDFRDKMVEAVKKDDF
ncbi:DUF4468 domain-containing protein [Chryseobacterium sp. SG20098]|uniref:DUF4468 domain-containing protein n=1 Tax=Chryseobacterium sp. SG20098 TaxID=3074145 RepID=UPI00288353CB|nr:DUF4468 domain-containing protein [Chryseobacterium sp. SG20098]WNI34664.1 DUF4468 domain-containing protein [Chryseobacterium sp. SG20098]